MPSPSTGRNRLSKKAILLVAFGTSDPEAARAFELVEKRARERFPDVEMRWAYTSKMIRTKLSKQGKRLDSPETAFAMLMDEGYTHVAVLSLHTIPGEEFHELYQKRPTFQPDGRRFPASPNGAAAAVVFQRHESRGQGPLE